LDQEWLARWQTTRQLQQQLESLVQQLQGASALPGVQQRVEEDLQRVLRVEQRVNHEMAEPLGEQADTQLKTSILFLAACF
jgi:mannitol-specific phosphotransferase system IIBC component